MSSSRTSTVRHECRARCSGRTGDHHTPTRLLIRWLQDNNILLFGHSDVDEKTTYSRQQKTRNDQACVTSTRTDCPNHQHALEVLHDVSSGCRGILHFLEITALCQAGEWSKCLNVLHQNDQDFPSELRGQIQYIKAYCLYHHGDYSSAMATGQALLQTLLDDGASSECHNLIGCCLSKMGKPHMALQQFRNALASSCSTIHTPSLYNISLQYRELGMDDAELESLKLLVTAFESSGKVDDKEVTTTLGPTVILRGQTCSTSSATGQIWNINHLSALYIQAKRCLDLNRNDIAADRFLDLLSILESSPIMMSRRCGHSTSLLPSSHTIYLDAATALLRVNKVQEALAVCDKILSKSKFLHHGEDGPSLDSVFDSQEEIENTDGLSMSDRFSTTSRLLSDKRDQGRMQNSRRGQRASHPAEIENSSTNSMNLSGDDIFDDTKRISGTNRKRQRESSSDVELRFHERGMMGEEKDAGWTSESKVMEEEKLYTSHALILQAECFQKQNDDAQTLELLNQSLEILQTCRTKDAEVTEMLGHGVDKNLSLAAGGRGKAKRRRIQSDEDETSDVTTQPVHQDNPPITSAVSELKSRAYNNRSTIWIGQNKLQRAMQDVLLSLQCLPSNAEAKRNHALLLEKLGRKDKAATKYGQN